VADVALAELRVRLGEDGLVLFDVRSPHEYEGHTGAHCDPRQGHIPGAVNLPLERIFECHSVEDVRALVGLPAGTEVIAYCHSGSRSRHAVQVLREAGYDARNYVGSWHEWSRDPALPAAPE
jgi:thiosulfate/3-mercaptopyruvate sulfurtransferase